MRSRVDSLRVGVVAWAVLAGLGLGACSGGTKETGSVEILHWWKQGGEHQAISALLGEFKNEYPSIGIIDSSVDGSSLARAAIRERMKKGTPPDTFQANGGWDLMAWVLVDNTDAEETLMRELDPAMLDLVGKVPQPVLDTVSYMGKVYAVPLNIHRLNTLFYNKQVFRDLQIDATELKSVDDLFAAADKVNAYNQQQAAADGGAKQVTPIALGFRVTTGPMASDDSWTLALVFFENLWVARKGGAAYRDLFVSPQTDDPFSPAMSYALADFRKLVVSYSNANAKTLTWNQPLDMVLNGDAAMTIMGDWGKGYAKAAGFGEDTFGVIPMPGTAGTFVFTTDTFSLPISARPVDDTLKLLKLFGSQQGQDIFNPIKGSISARTDSNIGNSTYDAMAKQTYADFVDASNAGLIFPATSILAQQSYLDAISGALAAFAAERANANPSTVQHTLDDYADVLRSSCWPACRPPPPSP